MSIIKSVGVYCLVACLLGFLGACTTVEPTLRHQALAEWVDHYHYDAVYQLGRPFEVYRDGTSGRVLVYEHVFQQPAPGRRAPEDSLAAYDFLVWENALDRSVPTRYAQVYDLLYVDRDGRIYSYQSNTSSRQERVAYENGLVVAGILGGAVLLVLLVLSAQQDAGTY